MANEKVIGKENMGGVAATVAALNPELGFKERGNLAAFFQQAQEASRTDDTENCLWLRLESLAYL